MGLAAAIVFCAIGMASGFELHVGHLSDEDLSTMNDASEPRPPPPAKIAKRMPASKRGPKLKFVRQNSRDLKLVRNRANGRCGCLCQCFYPFRDAAIFSNLAKVLKTLDSLDKLGQDDYA